MVTGERNNVVEAFVWNNPAKLFPPDTSSFSCHEELDEDGEICFHCTVSDPHQTHNFVFTTRERSVGVILQSEERETTNNAGGETTVTPPEGQDDHTACGEEEPLVDPFFFDPGYTLAATTGFQIWAGTRMLVDAMLHLLLSIHEEDIVVELGGGVGVVGTCWAATTGATIILTDLPTLVEHAMVPNLRKNSNVVVDIEEDELDTSSLILVGRGRVLPLALDWTKEVPSALKETDQINWIIASDCVWLRSMLNSLLNTVQQIFAVHPEASFVLSFQKRGNHDDDDTMFTTPTSVYKELRARNWSVTSLAWRPVRLSDGSTSEVYLWQVKQTWDETA